MITRVNFIKSLIALVAVPSAIVDISKSLVVSKTKYAYWWKISVECFKDKEFMEYLFTKESPMIRKSGIDLDKPFTFKTGYIDDDFPRNIITVMIEQEK